MYRPDAASPRRSAASVVGALIPVANNLLNRRQEYSLLSSPCGGEDRSLPFNTKSRLDPSQVEDRRGGRGTGTTMAIGGGGIGLVVLVVALLLGVDPSSLGGLTQQPAAPAQST